MLNMYRKFMKKKCANPFLPDELKKKSRPKIYLPPYYMGGFWFSKNMKKDKKWAYVVWFSILKVTKFQNVPLKWHATKHVYPQMSILKNVILMHFLPNLSQEYNTCKFVSTRVLNILYFSPKKTSFLSRENEKDLNLTHCAPMLDYF